MRLLWLSLLWLLWPTAGFAESPTEPATQVTQTRGQDGLVFSQWADCWFIATSTDLGLFYLRPRVSLGYGRPHTAWAGIDLNPTLSLTAPGGYAGLRFSVPHVDLRVGSRASYSRVRQALVPKQEYDQDEISIRPDGLSSRAAYLSTEAELTLDIPIGFGALTTELAATYIALRPADLFIFEERLRVVTDPPWIGKARLGYRFPFYIKGLEVALEPASEVIIAQNRSTPTIRAGLLLGVKLDPRLSVRANLMHTVQSPDHLNFTGSHFGEITLRWRSAWSFFR